MRLAGPSRDKQGSTATFNKGITEDSIGLCNILSTFDVAINKESWLRCLRSVYVPIVGASLRWRSC